MAVRSQVKRPGGGRRPDNPRTARNGQHTPPCRAPLSSLRRAFGWQARGDSAGGGPNSLDLEGWRASAGVCLRGNEEPLSWLPGF